MNDNDITSLIKTPGSHDSHPLQDPRETVLARPGQTLIDHLTKVSYLAALFGSKIGVEQNSKAAGAKHDVGKNLQSWQSYLQSGGEKVIHSLYGAKHAYNDLVDMFPPAAEILGNIIAAHHGSLYDNLACDGKTPLLDKLSRVQDIPRPTDSIEIDIQKIQSEIENLVVCMADEDKLFGISMLTKYIYSCLIDADRLDAYYSEMGLVYQDKKTDWINLLDRLTQHLSTLDKTSPMTPLRELVSAACLQAGSRPIGIYKLEVPTGGGKTLSGLRFALEHAKTHDLDRIIYVIPYLSILSQTADEIRDALGINYKDGKNSSSGANSAHGNDRPIGNAQTNDNDQTSGSYQTNGDSDVSSLHYSDYQNDILLEHHSDFLPDKIEYYKLQTDRWDTPIILTTQVQFLESVFSARGSDLRKLHNMARSVIIFDEVQNLPIKCVHLFNAAINFLHSVCKSTVLLCTATQPVFDKVERSIKLSENPSIVKCDDPPKRYEIVPSLKPGGYSYGELAEFVLDKHKTSTLIIVNTKSAAKLLFEELKHRNAPVLHLSTNMCSAHRDDVLGELFRRLNKGNVNNGVKEPVICVSTQLIEAGVNISFECVIRDIAGYDSVLQGAGRCNRHGEFGRVMNVYIINIKGENLARLPDIKLGAEITEGLISDKNLSVDAYFRKFFYSKRIDMDYLTKDGNDSIYNLLTRNVRGCDVYRKLINETDAKPPALISAIRSAANEFYVIDKGREEVIAPYKGSEDLLSKYMSAHDDTGRRRILRLLGKYSVSLYRYQLDELMMKRAIDTDSFGGLTVLRRGFYDEERGVDLEGHPEFLCV